MRALSVKQPWAELIASGRKSLEIRTWSTRYRGDLLIVSGLRRAMSIAADDWPNVDGPRGAAVCIVELVDVVKHAGTYFDSHACSLVEQGSFAWVLRNARRVEPVPVVGRLGLFWPPNGIILAPLARCDGASNATTHKKTGEARRI